MNAHDDLVEAVARALCKANGNCVACDGRDLCPQPSDCRDWGSFDQEARAALAATNEWCERAVADEREACAKMLDARADSMLARSRGGLGTMFADQSATDLKVAATAIRARANPKGKAP